MKTMLILYSNVNTNIFGGIIYLMESYEEFASLYDELINGDIDYTLWSKTIVDMCNKYHISWNNYLDVGCGTGNMSIKLAAYFKHIYGVDLSEQMLFEAGEKFRSERLNSILICQDMRYLELNRTFDLITCCLDAVNYLLEEEDIKKYFYSIKKHLNLDGLFIFDINSHYKLSNIIGNNTFTYCEDDLAYIWENFYEFDVVNMYLTFFVKKGEAYYRFDEEHRERAYLESDLERILSDCGFIIMEKMDNYFNKEVHSKTERITYVCKLC
jgi:ubiquinone/menaquinone biosynthesis C-methylase UbiE